MRTLLLRRVLLALLPAMITVAVAVSAIWSDGGLVARQRLAVEVADANAELATVERENQRLLRQLHLMDADPVVLERMVADELGWGRQGATLYRFE